MKNQENRGSVKLMEAWKARTISEESVQEIVQALDQSPAKVERANVVGGANPTGVQLSLRYDGDDGPWCGNDILFWFKWHRSHGGVVHPPRILINGIPFPDLVRMELDFGHVGEPKPDLEELPGQLAEVGQG